VSKFSATFRHTTLSMWPCTLTQCYV
jgi:hypothetical protein